MTGAIEGYVWVDQDADSLRDEGEAGLAGQRVWLQSIESTVLGLEDRRETVTDVGGRYRFDDLLPGTYLLEIADPPIYVPTTPLRFAISVRADAVASPPSAGFYRLPWVIYLPVVWQ